MTPLTTAGKMNRQYRFQRHIYDATRTHYLFWRRRLISELDPPPGGTIVEIACGTGWNLLRAAETYPRASLYGLDISKEMLATASASVVKHGFKERIALAEGDATAFDLGGLFGLRSANRIIISYALSMIPAWPDTIERAVASLAPDGSLHIVDFGRMDGLTAAGRWSLRRWLRHYNVSPRVDLESTVNQIAARHGLHLTFEETRRGYTAYAVLRRK